MSTPNGKSWVGPAGSRSGFWSRRSSSSGTVRAGSRGCVWSKTSSLRVIDGALRPRPTDVYEELNVGLVFRSVGYRGVALPGIPFHDTWGVILNEKGRVIDPETQSPIVGEYTAGWIKRGPSGIIGTNKPCALETVTCMMEDLEADQILEPSSPDVSAAEDMIRRRKPSFVSYADWLRLDEIGARTRGRARAATAQVHEGRGYAGGFG